MRAALAVAALALVASPAFADATPAILAVLDTGIHPGASFLGSSPLVAWVDLVGDADGAPSAEPYDDVGHGTAVASIGVALAPGVSVAAARVLDGSGSGSVDDVVEGLYWASDVARADVAVVAISAILPAPADHARVAAAIRHAEDRGTLVVWAAGNGLAGAPVPPSSLLLGAASPRALVVGAADAVGAPWGPSNWEPDLLAWGVDVPVEDLGGASRATGSSYAAAWVGGFAAAASPTTPERASACALRRVVLDAVVDRAEYPSHVEGHGFLPVAEPPAARERARAPCGEDPPGSTGEATRRAVEIAAPPERGAPEGPARALVGSPLSRAASASAGVGVSGVDAASVRVDVSDWGRPFTLRATGATGAEDADVVFRAPEGAPVRAFATAGDEAGRVPFGAATAELRLAAGVDASFDFRVT